MFHKKRLYSFTAIHFIAYFLLLLFGSKHDWSNIIDNIFSLLAPMLSSILLFLIYKKLKGSDKYFWLLLALGSSAATIAEIIQGYNEIIQQKGEPSQNWSDFFYLIQIVFYFMSFIYKFRKNAENLHLIKFIFDTSIIMTVAITFSWHFILSDIIVEKFASNLHLFISIGYPVGHLMLLFGAVGFFLGSENLFPSKVLNFLLGSLLVQSLIEPAYLYLNAHNLSFSKAMLAPFFSLSFLLVGISGTFAIGVHVRKKQESPHNKYNLKDSISFRILLPYLSVLLLFTVLIFTNKEDISLIFGSGMAILLVVSRQIFTAVENQTLLAKYHSLTEELELKIEKRTEELSSKNHQLTTAVQKMKHMAFHDVLSGLPNRRLFLARLISAMEEARLHNHKIAVVFIDLDRFKNINDTLGHEFGDLLLKHVSKQMQKSVRKFDTISRQGGDEFTVILNNISSRIDVIPLIQKLQSIVSKPIVIKGQELHVSMSIGIAIYPNDGNNTEELMKNADMAMYCVKEEGRNGYKFFSKDMNQIISRKMTLEKGLRKAIANHEFVLFYQPQVFINTGEVVGVEALIRWNSMEAGMVSPAEFIPIAEETGLIIPIGEWVFNTACEQAKTLHDAGYSHLKLAVNLSPIQFLHDNLVRMIVSALEKTGFNPQYLELEITEGVAFNDAEEAMKKMQVLRDLGVRISIDDFGTGYSSLMYLKRFPINTLKIAQPFIKDIVINQSDQALVEAIASLAHSLGLNLIAEGAETKEQLLTLRGLRCDQIQGDIFSKPLTIMQLSALLESKYNGQILS